MRSHRYAELAFEAPPEWADVSVVTFARPTAAGYAPHVELTRATDNPRLTVEAFAKKETKSRRLKKHRVVADGAVKIDGAEGYRLEHRFQSPERVDVHQLQYFFRTDTDVAVLALTCAVNEIDEHRPLFESISASIRRESND